MAFDIREADRLLTTTRAVRQRLDLDRPVSDQILSDCIEVAEQAPSGGNITSRRWIVIKDSQIKSKLAELYRIAGGSEVIERAKRQEVAGSSGSRVSKSASYLAQNMEKVPALVLLTIMGRHDGSGRPGLFDSVIQAGWSFCLALRARGLGSAWTTMHLGKSDEIAGLLGIPDEVTQIVLLPVAWTKGNQFQAATRKPVTEITWVDNWGYTKQSQDEELSLLEQMPGVTVEVDIKASGQRVWELVSDLNVASKFSDEFLGADWSDDVPPIIGSSFVGRNQRGDRYWETTSYVRTYEPPNVFAWNVGDLDLPSAQWKFEIDAIGDQSRLRHSMIIGPGIGGTARAMRDNPDNAHSILKRRREQLQRNMELTIRGIKKEAESRA